MSNLAEWYRVGFDERAVYRDVAPPGGEPWSDHFGWDDIVRVCFITGSLFESDELYIFTSTREESYVIPTEAEGGQAVVDELLRRELFSAEMMIEAVTTEGQLFCWQPVDKEHQDE
jgi:hypothetical protein